MNLIIQFFSSIRPYFSSRKTKSEVDRGIGSIVSRHGDALIKLEKYDKDEVKRSKNLVRYPTVRSYLQQL
ncbi:hypothetical protein KJ707_02815 [Patescibacteria group bacterium]|nr:hypothetical protein [Patescibacteria group bacterium]MBU1967252.1 hypothetical protein [Patescibacteria group bacterium]MBU2543469.1 hypothetical protein [Patescibacteria group bacterium]